MYRKSKQHLLNLERARLAAVSQKKKCSFCEKEFSKAGFSNHYETCKNGKNCPVCNVWFFGKSTTCSRGCANSYFRSGENNPNWKEHTYRTTCFIHHEMKCCVCGEDKIVEVHHFDENKKNNKIDNLIPLCPTHHQYVHSRYKNLIIEQIEEYIKKWKEGKKQKRDRSPIERKTKRDFAFQSKWR